MAVKTLPTMRMRRLGALAAIVVVGGAGAGIAIAATPHQSGVGFTCEGKLATQVGTEAADNITGTTRRSGTSN